MNLSSVPDMLTGTAKCPLKLQVLRCYKLPAGRIKLLISDSEYSIACLTTNKAFPPYEPLKPNAVITVNDYQTKDSSTGEERAIILNSFSVLETPNQTLGNPTQIPITVKKAPKLLFEDYRNITSALQKAQKVLCEIQDDFLNRCSSIETAIESLSEKFHSHKNL